jgi:hypothetical protein
VVGPLLCRILPPPPFDPSSGTNWRTGTAAGEECSRLRAKFDEVGERERERDSRDRAYGLGAEFMEPTALTTQKAAWARIRPFEISFRSLWSLISLMSFLVPWARPRE